MYSSKITYPIQELNSSYFLEVLRNVLEIELLKQKTSFNKIFLPQVVKKDDYLLNPIADSDLDPSFCAIVKAKSIDSKSGAKEQQNTNTTYLIKVAAYGLDNLRKIQDVIFQILNDIDVKHYFFQLQREVVSGDIFPYNLVSYQVIGGDSVDYNGNEVLAGEKFKAVTGVTTYTKTSGNETVVEFENNIFYDDDAYSVNSINTELEVKKSANDRDFITGDLQVDAPISENTKINDTIPIVEIKTEFQLGENGIKIEQQTNY